MTFIFNNLKREHSQGQLPHQPRKQQWQRYRIGFLQLVWGVPVIGEKVCLVRGVIYLRWKFPQVYWSVRQYIVVREIVVIGESLDREVADDPD